MLDSRVLKVLQRLESRHTPTMAERLFSIHDAPPPVVASALRAGKQLGFCDYEIIGRGNKYWDMTEKGRAMLKEFAL